MKSWIHRAALMVLAIASIATFSSQTASACSCGPSTPQEQIEWSDAGFVGTLAAVAFTNGKRADPSATYSFDVEFWLNGELDTATAEVTSSAYGASCGIEVPVGQRAAVFVTQRGDQLVGSLCATLGADTTLAALDDTPAGGGTALFAVPGRFSDGAFAMLDDGGRVVGYRGTTEEIVPPQIHLCTDGQHAISLGFPIVEVIDLATFEVVASVDTGDLQQQAGIADVHCTGPQPDDTRLLVESADATEVDIRLLSASEQPGARFPLGRAGRPQLVADGVWSREFLDPGEQLVAIASDGARSVIEVIERPSDSNFAGYESIVARPDLSQVAVSQVTYRSDGIDGQLSMRDAATGNVVVSVPANGESIIGWTADDRLVTHNSTGQLGDLIVRDAVTLEVISTIRSWPAWGATLVGDWAWATESGTVYRGSLATGEVEIAAVLPSDVSGRVIALADPVDVEPVVAPAAFVTPRAPSAITEPELAARADVEAASQEQADAAARGEPGMSIGLAGLVGLLIAAVLAAIGATVSAVRERSASHD